MLYWMPMPTRSARRAHRTRPFAVACACLLISAICGTEVGFAQAADELIRDPTWRLEWSNDALLDSDNQYTNGLSIQKHSAPSRALQATTGTPAVGKLIARHFLPDDAGLTYREAWAIAHYMQTPDDKESSELIPNDVPYVGLVSIANAFIAYDEDTLRGFQLSFGWVGPKARAEDVQQFIHQLNGSVDALGWEHQLDDEPMFDLYYLRKNKLWRRPHFDGGWSLEASLGNVFTMVQPGIEMRFGRMPGGFASVPAPMGRGMVYAASLPQPARRNLYASVALSATRLFVDLPRDGNILVDGNEWTESNTIQPAEWVGQLVLGLHIERQVWAARLTYWLTTDTFDAGPGAAPVTDSYERDDSFGAFSLEWRFE
jgi:lipid A 3-O-deacylase